MSENKNSAAVTPPAVDYAAEVRFGVVMYGGVSLAIYINGVANELYEMVCATADAQGAASDVNAGATREIYRRLSWLIGNPALRASYAQALRQRPAPAAGRSPADVWQPAWTAGLQATRLVVDVVSGTSAGGINGIFLAKALANGEPFAPLRKLWLREGDIGLLLNDKRSYAGLAPGTQDRSGAPQSLLNSDRMYFKLFDAMQAMSEQAASTAAPAQPLVDEMDLFVTTTDIAGSPVALRLFDKVVYERRYKQSYHFSMPEGISDGGNDLAARNNPFLAFAARCTSSFPFAFEPMTLATLTRLNSAGAAPGVRRWDAFFPNLRKQEVGEGKHVHRAFGDGGYLDNKPFTYVVETLSTRHADVPLERKLLYVEPSPQHLDPDAMPSDQPPDAISNSLAALTSIPQYETIREDLQSVLKRNRRIERVERMVRLGEADIEAQPDPFAGVLGSDGQLPAWDSLPLRALVGFYGVAFLPYRRLRVYSVTDSLADRLAVLWNVDRESDHLYALRTLVRAWRDMNYAEEPAPGSGRQTVNAFLGQFDFDYRLRRLGFLLRKTDQLTRLFTKRLQGPLPDGGDGPTGLSESDEQLAKRLQRDGYDLRSAALDAGSLERALAALRALKVELNAAQRGLRGLARQAMQHARAAHALDDAARVELAQVLSLLLGEREHDAAPLLLRQVAGGAAQVQLPAGWQRASSASRTLQESVFIRAQGLLMAAGAAGRTQLQEMLESSLTSMRLKPATGSSAAGTPGADAAADIAAAAWTALGQPTLQRVERDGVATAVAVVGDTGTAALDSAEGRRLRRILGELHLRFDAYDQMSFPLYYDTGTGEPSTVEVVRISPEDAPHLIDEAHDDQGRRKLAGTTLFNFGAFLDARWRRNDIMWGRLDGAERLIQALLPATDDDTQCVRAALIDLAHGHILREALVPNGHDDLTGLLCEALGEMQGASTDLRLRELLRELQLGDTLQRDQLAGILTALLSERGLMDYVRDKRDVDRELDPRSTLDSAARAVTITGRVLDGIATRHGHAGTAVRWMARGGLMLQGLLAVSLPGSLRSRWWTHGMKVLYAFELFMLLAALLLGSADARSFALTALGVTLALHLLSLVAGDLLRARGGWLRVLAGAVGIAVIALAAAGALGLRHVAPATLACGPADAAAPEGAICRWMRGADARTPAP